MQSSSGERNDEAPARTNAPGLLNLADLDLLEVAPFLRNLDPPFFLEPSQGPLEENGYRFVLGNIFLFHVDLSSLPHKALHCFEEEFSNLQVGRAVRSFDCHCKFFGFVAVRNFIGRTLH